MRRKGYEPKRAGGLQKLKEKQGSRFSSEAPRRLADVLILNFCSEELKGNKFMVFKAKILWKFFTVTIGNQHKD